VRCQILDALGNVIYMTEQTDVARWKKTADTLGVAQQTAMPETGPETWAKEIWPRVKVYNAASPPLLPQRFFILAGLPLSGKTFLARKIMELSTAPCAHIENDYVRKHVTSRLGKKQPDHTHEESDLVYRTSMCLVDIALSNSLCVIFDATNLREKYREPFYAVGDMYGAEVAVIKTAVSRETAEKRSRHLLMGEECGDNSDATVEIYDLLREEDEPIELCKRKHFLVWTDRDDTAGFLLKNNLFFSNTEKNTGDKR